MNAMVHIRASWVLAAVALTVVVAAACSSADPSSQPGVSGASASATPTLEIQERYALQQSLDFTITLTTTSIGGTFNRLNRAHTCERGDTSPDLAWDGVPEGAASLALVFEDQTSDVYGLTVDVLWAHWVVYSIPPDVTELEPGQVAGEVLENGARQGANDYERVQYNGPCPLPTLTFPIAIVAGGGGGRRQSRPSLIAEDRPYYFRIYALDSAVDVPSGADRDTLLGAIDGHIMAAGELAVPYKSTKGFACKTTDQTICSESVQR